MISFLNPLSAWRNILHPFEGFGYARNRTMAANIEKAYQERPEHDAMLTITGKAHLPGIAARLTQEHGFEEIKIPSLDQ